MNKCDIVIPVWNLLELTKDCLDSIFRNTRVAHRIIIIDNASDEETRDYLKDVSSKRRAEISLIRNESNLGTVKAFNQGINLSTAEFVCLLNNDTQVADGWLGEMLKVAQAQEDIGTVNPNSNTLGCKPKRGESVEMLGRQLKSYSGEWAQLPMASGFCMLIKRKVIQAVGLFDEIYGMGYFEDADYSKRVQKLGFRCVCARAAYVYHHEKKSFIKFRQFDKNFARNRQIFYDKWGKPQRLVYVLSKDDPSYKKRMSQEALKRARQGDVVWFLLKGEDSQFLDIHPNIYIYNLPRDFFNLISFWRIIKRKKKFDKIYVDDRGYGKRLNNFKVFHKAEVIYGQ